MRRLTVLSLLLHWVFPALGSTIQIKNVGTAIAAKASTATVTVVAAKYCQSKLTLRRTQNYVLWKRCHDIQHKGTQPNNIQHNDTQHNDIKHNNKQIATLSITTLSITTLSMTLYVEYCYAEYHLCWMPFILSVTNKPFMLSVVMLNVVMLNVMVPLKQNPLCFNYFCKLFCTQNISSLNLTKLDVAQLKGERRLSK
jgi:hypothetical protein